ncbi:MAG: tetratricopeptide repeat protein [Alphaproteobacteria bacterium]|nr:tetratricopeptide repeat protein [Alphaproteobacteria bacterium]
MKRALFVFGVLIALHSPVAALDDGAFEQALSLAAEKRYPEAREMLEPLLRREPGNPRARLLHGILRVREGRLSEAIEAFETLRNDFPEMSEPYNNLAVLHAMEGRLEVAREILLATLERRPNAVAYANLGDVYAKLSQRAYERARALDAGDDPRPQREMDTTPVLPASPDSPPAASRGGRPPEPREPVAGPAATAEDGAPSAAGAGEPGHAAESRELAAASPDGLSGPGESREAAGTPPGAPDTTAVAGRCARVGGFPDRRAVADAALWLQSNGVEVVEVRHEERQVASTYRIYLPPIESREEAVGKLREIRARGVRDVALIRDGEFAGGISFGIYRKADNLHRRVAELDRLGYTVKSHPVDVEAVEEYTIRARTGMLDPAWAARFPGTVIRTVDCG